MCGIFGYYNRNGYSLNENIIRKMGEAISHRGPDDFGVFSEDGVAIGNRRLSIIDIEGGRQPFISDDGNIAVVQNGEIYNHIELAEELKKSGYPCRSNSDTEVLLRLYERDGISFIEKLNGMFAIAIYDKRKETLFIIRDRVGVKPLYFYNDNENLLFSSEIKSILKAGIPREIDSNALNHYLSFNYVPLPYTIFKGVQHLMPGHLLSINKAGISMKKWWNLSTSTQEEEHYTEEEWIEQFNTILDDAVRIRLRADVPFGAFLSGGIDSSTVVGLMSNHLYKPVKTFSIGFHEPKFDESKYAQYVANLFKTEHTLEKVDNNMLDLWPHMIYHCDQPHGDVSFMPTYRVSELASKHVKMVLTGDGADELFAGYDKYKSFFSNEQNLIKSDTDFQKSYFKSISLFNEEDKVRLLSPSFINSIDNLDSFEVVKPMFNEVSHMDRVNQALYIDTMQLLPGNNLVKPDRMGMAASIEARTPFLDVRLVELAFRMPGSIKLKQNETKYIYKKAVTPLLGEEIVYRKKQMFTVPIGEWFKDQLAGFVEDKLLHGQLLERNIINKSEASRLITEHKSGASNNTREIRALISLEYWLEEFMG